MTRVLVVEFDKTLRGVLHEMLTAVGHCEVMEVTTETAALEYLTACREGVVAVCSNTHADHHLSTAFFAAVVADKRLARRHQYLLLSTDPAKIPEALRRYVTQLHAPILPKPFDMDVLLTAVAHAAGRLTPARPKALLRLEAAGVALRKRLAASTARLR